MRAVIKIECIGDGGRLGPSRYGVSEISGIYPSGGLRKVPLRCNKDYSKANSVGSRGVYAYYIVKPGCIYEVHEPVSWKRTKHYFCTVTLDGEIVELTMEEVFDRLRRRITPPPHIVRQEVESLWQKSRSESTSMTQPENE